MLQKQKRFRSFLPAIIAVGILGIIGSTIAFNSDFTIFSNLFHTKDHVATNIEDFTPPTDWITCEEVPKTLVTRNDSNHDIYVRLAYDEFWKASNGTTNLPLVKDGIRLANISFQNQNDWELKADGWYYFKQALAPGESTTSLFRAVTLDCSASLGGDNVCTETPTGIVCEKPADPYENSQYHLKITVQTTENEDGFPESEVCRITINPNGGTYNGSNDTYTDTTRCGSSVDLTSIAPASANLELRDWTKEIVVSGEPEISTLGADTTSYTLDTDTVLTANWQSNIFYDVTVNPNGGSYDGSTSPSVYSTRDGSTFTIGEATLSGYYVDYWSVTSGSAVIVNNSFVVAEDTEITAHWDRAVARIERTGKLYSSIMAAENDAQTNDTITLLVDTTETVTNSKQVTLDLNSHTVTGSLTNTTAGNLTIINGEINNSNGAAVINNGILTLGVDDYDPDTGVANVINNNVRLIGTTAGLYQDNDTYEFYYYDGYLEGDLGLVGGYDGSPFYRTVIGVEEMTINYFPNVEHMEADGRTYQHVELKSANRAVSKTSNHGDIYYYNLQDNIDVSAITGYKIYAARDFDASYPITVSANDEIEIELDGHTINFGETMTNNGTLTICSSNNSGLAVYSLGIVNNSDLTFCDITVNAANSATLIENRDTLNLENATLSSSYGRVLSVLQNGTTLNIDNDSYLISTNSNANAIYNTSTDLTISGGNISGIKTIENRGALTVTGGNISGTEYAIYSNGSGTVVNVDGGNMSSTGANSSYGTISGNRGTLNLTDGNISCVTTTSNYCYGVRSSIRVNMSGGRIYAQSPYEATGILANSEYDQIVMTGGTIEAVGTGSGKANGVELGNYSSSVTLSNGTITATTANSVASGIRLGVYGGYIAINSGTVSATSTNSTSYGIYNYYASNRNNNIYGGTVSGGTYGIGTASNASNNFIIGTNDDNLDITTPVIIGGQNAISSNGNFYFYDGVLKGRSNAYANIDAIKAVPDGARTHLETIDGYENCWLEADDPYLEVNDTQYNSLTKAYNAAASGDTITVIRDFTTNAALPSNPSGKSIIIDLNGHTVTYTQSLVNNGTMEIRDDSTNHDGKIINNTNPTIANNNGTLTISSGTIQSNKTTISGAGSNTGSSVVNVTGGKVISLATTSSTGQAISSQRTLNLSGGEIACIQSHTSNYECDAVTGINTINITGGKVYTEGTSLSWAKGISSFDNLHIDGGLIETVGSSTNNSSEYMSVQSSSNNTSTHMTAGTIRTTTTGSAIATGIKLWRGSVSITGGTIESSSVSNIARGIHIHADGGSTTVSDSDATTTITATSTNSAAYGIHNTSSTVTVLGGYVYGKNYGIYNTDTTKNVILGSNNNNISAVNPEIVGDQYGVNGGNIYFYDGVIKGATNAHNSNVIAVPDGAHTKTETIGSYENCWLIEDEPYLEVNNVQYNSLTKAYNNAASGDTIKVIRDFTTSAALPSNPSGKSIIIDLNGHTITYTQSLVNNGTMEIRDDSTNHNGKIINNTNPTITTTGPLTISSGNIVGSYGSSSGSDTYVIYNNSSSTININGGKIDLIDGSRWSSYSVISSSGKVIIAGGEISCTISMQCTAVHSSNSVNMSGGKIYAESSNSYALGITAPLTISGGEIEVVSTGNYEARALYLASATITGGTFKARSTNGAMASGIYLNNGSSNISISNATIEASSTGGSSYGIYAYYASSSNITITSGKISGGTNGIAIVGSSINAVIGANDGNLSTTSPEIIGGQYALSSGNSYYFYDGVLKGGTKAYVNDYYIKAIATNTEIASTTEMIDGVEYKVKYLATAQPVAQIVGGSSYTSLPDAFAAAAAGDTIQLIADTHIYNSFTIPSTVDVTLDLNNHSLSTSSPITNNGKLVLTDNLNSNNTIEYIGSDDRFLVNASGATLTITGLSLISPYIISNAGTLTIDGATLVCSSSCITNSNNGSASILNSSTLNTKSNAVNHSGTNLIIDNSTILNSSTNYSSNHLVYINSSSAIVTITDSTLTGHYASYRAICSNNSQTTTVTSSTIRGGIYNYAGTMTIDNSDIYSVVSTSTYSTVLVDNNGTLQMTDSSIDNVLYNYQQNTTHITLRNSGTATITDSTLTGSFGGSYVIGVDMIYNSGTLTYTNSTITFDNSNIADNTNSATWGIENAGTLNYVSGTISIKRAKGAALGSTASTATATILSGTLKAEGTIAYGIYIDGATVTLGEAEPVGGPNWGQATANVNTTDPHIEGIGSNTGIGVKLASGHFNYYDGYLLGSTNAKPDTTSNIEYQYEADFHTDPDTGYEYCYLIYLPGRGY